MKYNEYITKRKENKEVMAKRFNIISTLEREIEKGNIYVTDSGNFVSEEVSSCNIQEDFIRALRNGEIGVDVTLSQFKEKQLNNKKNVHDLLTIVSKFVGIETLESLTEPSENDTVESETNTPSNMGGGYRVLSTSDIAAKLNVTPKTVRCLIESGELKAIKVGKVYRVSKEEFELFLEKSKINYE